MNRIIPIIFLLLNQNQLSAQTIVLVDTNKNFLSVELNYNITLIYDRKDTLVLNAKKSVFSKPPIKDCDSLIEVLIEGPFITDFYNQYYCHQFELLDTIQLSNRKVIKGQTPRLLLGNGFENDSIFNDQLWLKEWLSEYTEVVNGISFVVYSTEKLTRKEKRLVTMTIREYCRLIDKNEFKDKIIFKDECYSTGQEDLFNEGIKVTRSFIENQNTLEMKNKAEKYSIVVTVLIDWKRE